MGNVAVLNKQLGLELNREVREIMDVHKKKDIPRFNINVNGELLKHLDW